MGWSADGLFRAHRYHLKLNWDHHHRFLYELGTGSENRHGTAFWGPLRFAVFMLKELARAGLAKKNIFVWGMGGGDGGGPEFLFVCFRYDFL